MKLKTTEIIRYVINGIIATAVHFGVLTFNLKVLDMHSAGLANLTAAGFGIFSSFLGNRYFVFGKHQVNIVSQAIKFSFLYLATAIIHTGVLFIWSDCLLLDYKIGFLLATLIQFLVSYTSNKLMVFKV